MGSAKPLVVLLICSMLSACAGAARQDVVDAGRHRPDDHRQQSRTGLAETVETAAIEAGSSSTHPSPTAAGRVDHRHRRHVHRHAEPGPEARHAAEVALLVTAQVFVCSFVVVVLNGHCDFYVSTGHYY